MQVVDTRRQTTRTTCDGDTSLTEQESTGRIFEWRSTRRASPVHARPDQRTTWRRLAMTSADWLGRRLRQTTSSVGGRQWCTVMADGGAATSSAADDGRIDRRRLRRQPATVDRRVHWQHPACSHNVNQKSIRTHDGQYVNHSKTYVFSRRPILYHTHPMQYNKCARHQLITTHRCQCRRSSHRRRWLSPVKHQQPCQCINRLTFCIAHQSQLNRRLVAHIPNGFHLLTSPVGLL